MADSEYIKKTKSNEFIAFKKNDPTKIVPVADDVTNRAIVSIANATPIRHLSATDSDGVVVGYTIHSLPKNGFLYLNDVQIDSLAQVSDLTIAQVAKLSYRSNGVVGTEAFTFTAIDNDGLVSKPATIKIPVVTLAPEICDNGIDDDADGLIDLADPDCGIQLDFSCFDNAILTKGNPTSLYSLDIIGSNEKLIKSDILSVFVGGKSVNAIGFNPADDFFLGPRSGTNQFARIGSDGPVALFTVPGIPTNHAIISCNIDANSIFVE